MGKNVQKRTFKVHPISSVQLGDAGYFKLMENDNDSVDLKRLRSEVFQLSRSKSSLDLAELRVIKSNGKYILNFRQYMDPEHSAVKREIQDPEFFALHCPSTNFLIRIDGREITARNSKTGIYGAHSLLFGETAEGESFTDVGFTFNIILEVKHWSIESIDTLIHTLWRSPE